MLTKRCLDRVHDSAAHWYQGLHKLKITINHVIEKKKLDWHVYGNHTFSANRSFDDGNGTTEYDMVLGSMVHRVWICGK